MENHESINQSGYKRKSKRLIMLFLILLCVISTMSESSESPKCPWPTIDLPDNPGYGDILKWALLWENETWNHIYPDDPISPATLNKPAVPGGQPYWPELIAMDSTGRQLKLLADMIERLHLKGIDVTEERSKLSDLMQFYQETKSIADTTAAGHLYMAVRLTKRQLMLRDPDLELLSKILFVKRFPLEPSHNYSDHMDSKFLGGGQICTMDIPRVEGSLKPSLAKVTVLFETQDGIPRDPVADYDGETIYFALRPAGAVGEVYWHLMKMNADGSGLTQITDGPYHDYYPCPMPDGKLTFVSTRIECRFLCFVPMAFTLFSMNSDGSNLHALSHANLTEWGPTVMRDGRILWTRSEYQDKGANFGHTLWAMRPDGTLPEMVYGNTTKNCIMNSHEVPGSQELVGTMISHFGDFNGPIALIDPEQGRFNPNAVTNITPDVAYGYDMHWQKYGYKIATWPDRLCFRDPLPLSKDYFLVSHSPQGDWHAPSHRFGIYVIDRYGNRELLYLDPNIGSMAPTPLRKRQKPPILASSLPKTVKGETCTAAGTTGQFIMTDVYQGLSSEVKPGSIRYLRICEEVKHNVVTKSDGGFEEYYWNFGQYYASPIFKYYNKSEEVDWQNYQDVIGPNNEWPSYVAKGVVGMVPVEQDGSANFIAPAGKVLYFQVLDEDLNEIQRMRSVIQLQAGERRSCIGCHENRDRVPDNKPIAALSDKPHSPQSPPWGSGPFDYQKIVQPVFNKNCISCHNADHEKAINLSGTWDENKVPVSYRTLITKGLVDFADWRWWRSHEKMEAMTFGTFKSRLIEVLENGHHDVTLTHDEMRAIKCWIDLNCPLWPDYKFRGDRKPLTEVVMNQ